MTFESFKNNLYSILQDNLITKAKENEIAGLDETVIQEIAVSTKDKFVEWIKKEESDIDCNKYIVTMPTDYEYSDGTEDILNITASYYKFEDGVFNFYRDGELISSFPAENVIFIKKE
jgi:hypothetical protein